jgi:hypothetical protein
VSTPVATVVESLRCVTSSVEQTWRKCPAGLAQSNDEFEDRLVCIVWKPPERIGNATLIAVQRCSAVHQLQPKQPDTAVLAHSRQIGIAGVVQRELIPTLVD